MIRKLKLLIYCFCMRLLWRWSKTIFNWCEDNRPIGGFYIKNY
jgi:hypothetical protein